MFPKVLLDEFQDLLRFLNICFGLIRWQSILTSLKINLQNREARSSRPEVFR